MLLRRRTRNTATSGWRGIAAELLIVIVGVFLGLQAQEWNQRIADQRKERQYIERLTADFERISKDLRRCRDVYGDSIRAIERITTVLANPSGDLSNESLNDTLVQLTAGDIPASRSATFVEMLSTGDLGIVSDAGLREALVAYDQRAQANRLIWRSLRGELGPYMEPLYENVQVGIHSDKGYATTISGYDVQAMVEDPRFRSMLNVLLGMKANIYILCASQLDLVDEAQRLLTL